MPGSLLACASFLGSRAVASRLSTISITHQSHTPAHRQHSSGACLGRMEQEQDDQQEERAAAAPSPPLTNLTDVPLKEDEGSVAAAATAAAGAGAAADPQQGQEEEEEHGDVGQQGALPTHSAAPAVYHLVSQSLLQSLFS